MFRAPILLVVSTSFTYAAGLGSCDPSAPTPPTFTKPATCNATEWTHNVVMCPAQTKIVPMANTINTDAYDKCKKMYYNGNCGSVPQCHIHASAKKLCLDELIKWIGSCDDCYNKGIERACYIPFKYIRFSDS